MNVSKRPFQYLIGILAAFGFAVLAMVFGGKASAADTKATPTPTPIQDYVNKEQYLTGYYRGTVTSNTATVRTGPGTKVYPELKISDGTVVKLTKGTEVFIWGETKDVDLDVWYHITATFKNEQIEGYIYTGRVTRDNNQILFTPTPTPVPPTPTLVPTVTQAPAENTPVPTTAAPTPPENVKNITEKSKGNGPMFVILIVCLVIVALIVAYSIFQRAQEKKLEEEMERYTKRRPAMERLDGEDEDDFNEAKKKYYASMNFGHGENAKKSEKPEKRTPAAARTEEKYSDEFEDDVDEDDIKLSTPKKKEDIYEEDDFSDDDVKVVDDFRDNGNKRKSAAKSVTEDNLDFSDDDLEYFERLKGNLEEPSAKAIAAAGTAASILDESPEVDSYFESDDSSSEERLKIKLNALRPQDRFVHKLYGEGVVVENSDPDIIQVRFGRDLRFLKKDKLARKELVEL
ncbi:MAG: hypothetical protein J5643_03670 [Lachnospiraceae bacterium]|nr:hypothetical protein [Lachnospiraceae bacterium]